MQFTFLDMAGKTLFIRDDAERALWTQEEMSLDLEFPFVSGKVISTGQRVCFKDPTGTTQIYEIKQAKSSEPDHYQTITAEHICISELSDYHIDNAELTNVSASSALSQVLSGTGWSVGTVSTNPTSSGDISRGGVWNGVLTIKENWNVYIEPRVTLAANGTITRKLDILSTKGTSNGIRLSVDKNMLDPSVIYDDSEVATALYGYGGTDPNTPTSQNPQEISFENVVWTKTSTHPAKPKGQKYLEDPDATRLYGRNGKPRFAYYQNNDITDPNALLEKTWQTLQTCNKPAISIEGTVADLYRMGYADQPLKLHDIAMVEVLPIGYKQQIQIIRMTTDLLDPTATTLTIGAYIPNIIYIQRNTEKDASGGGGGGGGNKSEESTWKEFRTTIQAYQDGTGLEIKAVQNDIKNQAEEIAIQEGRLEVTYNKITAEVTDRRNADNELNGKITVEANRITQEVTQRKADVNVLSGRITVEAGKIEQIVEAVGDDGEVTAASICLAINEDNSTQATISANKIYLLGQTIANQISADYIQSKVSSLSNLSTKNVTVSGGLTCSGRVTANTLGAMTFELAGASFTDLIKSASVSGNTLTLTPLRGSPVTFSKATTLTGEWSSGVYTVTAKQNNTEVATLTTSLSCAPAQSTITNNVLYIPVTHDNGASTGYSAFKPVNARSGCVSGLSYYGGSITLYYKSGVDEYRSAGTHYWYYKNSSSSLSTWHTIE